MCFTGMANQHDIGAGHARQYSRGTDINQIERPSRIARCEFQLPRSRRPTNLLDGSLRSGSEPPLNRHRRRNDIAPLPLTQASPSPQPQHVEPDEIDRRYREIMRNSGNLRFGSNIIVQAHPTEMEIKEELGSGTCGQVYNAYHKKTGQNMAVKVMHWSGNSEDRKRILMDLDVVSKSLDCPFIVRCFGTFITESEVWICMEKMSTCLDKLLRQMQEAIPENILGKMAVAIIKALNYLKEKHGIIHRDVKPSNMLLDESGTIKLCDFGISGKLIDSRARTRTAGCTAYMSPERIEHTVPTYDIRADVWSLGISLVELATGRYPYSGCSSEFEVLTKIVQDPAPQLPDKGNYSEPFRNFIHACLTKDYSRRPKYTDLLRSDFIKWHEHSRVDVGAWFDDVRSRFLANSIATGGSSAPLSGSAFGGPGAGVVACLARPMPAYNAILSGMSGCSSSGLPLAPIFPAAATATTRTQRLPQPRSLSHSCSGVSSVFGAASGSHPSGGGPSPGPHVAPAHAPAATAISGFALPVTGPSAPASAGFTSFSSDCGSDTSDGAATSQSSPSCMSFNSSASRSSSETVFSPTHYRPPPTHAGLAPPLDFHADAQPTHRPAPPPCFKLEQDFPARSRMRKPSPSHGRSFSGNAPTIGAAGGSNGTATPPSFLPLTNRSPMSRLPETMHPSFSTQAASAMSNDQA